MTLRTLLPATLTTAALLALPVTAAAKPPEQVDSGTPASFAPVPASDASALPSTTTSTTDDGGLDALAVIGIAGGTLLLGAAAGAGASRVVANHHAVRP